MTLLDKQKLPATVLLGLALCSCGEVADGSDEADTFRTQESMASMNALTANALTANALTANALTANALTANALTANALTANSLTIKALQDPRARSLFKYVVGCALPEGTDITLSIGENTYTFAGQLGLAPSWGGPSGTCDSNCRAWVSGWVLSRVNYLGEAVAISVRGNKPELLAGSTERALFRDREATYYGDIFSSPQARYACLPPAVTSDNRVCGPSLTHCVMTIVGSCDQVCDPAGDDGSYPNCRNAAQDAWGNYPPQTIAYPGSVTVFLE